MGSDELESKTLEPRTPALPLVSGRWCAVSNFMLPGGQRRRPGERPHGGVDVFDGRTHRPAQTGHRVAAKKPTTATQGHRDLLFQLVVHWAGTVLV